MSILLGGVALLGPYFQSRFRALERTLPRRIFVWLPWLLALALVAVLASYLATNEPAVVDDAGLALVVGLWLLAGGLEAPERQRARGGA